MVQKINIDGLISEIGRCCLQETSCKQCKQERCLIGYCKKSLLAVLKNQNEFIDKGVEAIPYSDTKIYEPDSLIHAIGFLLNQCRNCNVYHDEECVINVIRSCLEVSLLGEHQDYRGSTLMYLGDIKAVNPEIANKILFAFQQTK